MRSEGCSQNKHPFCKAEGPLLGGYDEEKMISFVCGKNSQLGDYFFKKWEKTYKTCDFSRFWEIKKNLVISTSRHCLGHHLKQHFCKNQRTHLIEFPFNAGDPGPTGVEFVFCGENSPFCKNKIVLKNMVKVVN